MLRSLDPTWYGRIKVGLSEDPIERTRRLYTTGVPFPFVPYYAWSVTDMAYAEHIAHTVLADHRVNNYREHFDVIPFHRREEVLGTFDDPTEDEVLVCLDVLLELIEFQYQCSNLRGHYSVDVALLNDYSRQRKRTAKSPDRTI
ncbi:GIY-YIG nuclease family protein [Zoogloea sp.]|uniref:GIY-YIG nuclease family protein n=1 Tax=Zoogloea sp. TaxID=49181 RepID=UPI0035B2B286